MKIRTRAAFAAAAAVMMILAGTASAQMSDKDRERQIRKAGQTAEKASKVMNELMRIPANAIPEALLRDAQAIAVFPNVIKAAFGLGGQGGQGLISRRVPGGWSAPAAFKIAGGSAGLQIGASSTDYVMLFMTSDSLKNLLESRFEIGGEASAAAGPVGRTAKATTDAQLQAGILSYSRSKGLFAGISLTGAVISPDNDRNRALYNMEAKEILTGTNKIAPNAVPAAVKGFQDTVRRHAR